MARSTQSTFVKILRGGERIWCEVMHEEEGGSAVVRVDSHRVNNLAPPYGAILHLPADEYVFDIVRAGPDLRVVA